MNNNPIIHLADHRRTGASAHPDIPPSSKYPACKKRDNADIIGLALGELKRGVVSEEVFAHITAAAMRGDPAAQIVANKVLLRRYPWLALSDSDLKAFSRRVSRGIRDGQPVSIDDAAVRAEVRHDR